MPDKNDRVVGNDLQGREENPLLASDFVYKVSTFMYHETLGSLMERDVFVCRPEDTVRDVAHEMASRKLSSVVVTDGEGHPAGIVTERDLVRNIVAGGDMDICSRNIADIMTPDPVCLSPGDSLFDALSTFFKYQIKHLPVVDNDRVVGIVTLRHIMKIRYSEPFVIIGELDRATDPAEFRRIREDIVHLVKEKLSSRIDPVDIVTMLSLINADIHRRLLRAAIGRHGNPPAGFCVFVTGSHGRRENLLFPDQDFCVIIDDYDDEQFIEYDSYYYELCRDFSVMLDRAGFPFCTGNIMGQNPTWRKRISEWMLHIDYIFSKTGPYTVRYLTLMFDSAFLYGDKSLFQRYINHVYSRLAESRNLLRQMHEEEEGRHRVPLGLFHTFVTERVGDRKKVIDMKRSGLIFIIESSRLLAVKNGIRETSTLERLRGLVNKGIINREDSEYFENAYRVILQHTLMAQVENYLTRGTDDYYLNPYELSERNRQMLKQAFKAISSFQEIVRSEFGELVL
jgi:CBS domain-containing protein